MRREERLGADELPRAGRKELPRQRPFGLPDRASQGNNQGLMGMKKRTVEIAVACAMVFLFVTAPERVAQTSQAADIPLYLDPSQPINVRVDDLVAKMTLEEKVSQMVNQSRAIPRLMVPRYDWRSEALHGIAGAGIATVFPEPVGLAATF